MDSNGWDPIHPIEKFIKGEVSGIPTAFPTKKTLFRLILQLPDADFTISERGTRPAPQSSQECTQPVRAVRAVSESFWPKPPESRA